MSKLRDWLGYIIGFIMILLFMGLVFLAGVEGAKERYEMPDGIICKYIATNGMFLETYKFSGCSNGKIYINPETYKRFRA